MFNKIQKLSELSIKKKKFFFFDNSIIVVRMLQILMQLNKYVNAYIKQLDIKIMRLFRSQLELLT